MIRNLSSVAFVVLVLSLGFTATASAADPKITGGARNTCALSDAGAVTCWGENNAGQLGNGNTTNTHIAQQVTGLTSGVTDISVGEEFACAVLAGKVLCWGANDNGQQTPGATDGDPHPTPVEVAGLSGVVSVTAGYSSVCALLSDGTARCWGHNFYGQVGNAGPTGSSYHPIAQVSGVSGIVDIDSANFGFCALVQSGAVWCWGMNYEGQLGRLPAGFGQYSSVPMAVAGISGATKLVGGDSACVLVAGPEVKCWGDNFYYGVGDPTAPDVVTTPVTVPGIPGVVELTGSSDTKCVKLSDASIWCWGYNLHHQISPENGHVAPPVKQTFSSPPILLAEDGNMSILCWMSAGGAITCRGANYGGESGSPNINDNGVGDTVVPGVDLLTIPAGVAEPYLSRSGKVKADRRKKNYLLKMAAGFKVGANYLLAPACTGSVNATATWNYRANKTVRKNGKKKRVKVKRKKTWKASAKLAVAGPVCVANIQFKKLPVKTLNRKKLVISAKFAGNSEVAAFAFREAKVSLPKVTIRKRR